MTDRNKVESLFKEYVLKENIDAESLKLANIEVEENRVFIGFITDDLPGKLMSITVYNDAEYGFTYAFGEYNVEKDTYCLYPITGKMLDLFLDLTGILALGR